MISAPIDRYRRASKRDLAAMSMGAGAALLSSVFLPLNPQASFSLGLVWTAFGISGPGRMLADAVVRRLSGFTPQALRMVIAGIGPGFLLARILPFGAMFAGAGLLVAGYLIWTGGQGTSGSPGSSMSQAAGLILFAACGATLSALVSLLFPDHVHANDFGKHEAGGNFKTWWESQGRGHALGNAALPSGGAAVGPLGKSSI
jgi:hypothetical protein